MDCEICGKEIGKLRQTVVDGNTLFVCEKCASFGKEKVIEKTEEPLQRPAPQKIIPQQEFRGKEFDLGLEIDPEFGKKIIEFALRPLVLTRKKNSSGLVSSNLT